MNVFDTEHPLNSRPGRASFRDSRFYSFIRALLMVTLCLLPLLTGFIWYLNITDIDTADYEPEPFFIVAIAAAIGSAILSTISVSLFWLGSWLFRHACKRRSFAPARSGI